MHINRGNASRSAMLCLETSLPPPSNSSRVYYSRVATISLSACVTAATIRGRLYTLFEKIQYMIPSYMLAPCAIQMQILYCMPTIITNIFKHHAFD